LVGAGPGDPDLLTIRGARRLGEADLVLYDALSSDAMRAYAPRARWFFVGKRACRQSIGQDVLNRLMIKEARRGHHVVRLKCGDPFVFGRGGEELWALAEAGIPCEVVPGVSSAVAGPALAGIPVTHRGAASAFAVIAGHHEAVYRPLLSAMPTEGMTIVVLMGLAQRAAIAATLQGCGWEANTPAAIVIGAATAAAWNWTGTLAEMGAAQVPNPGFADAGTGAPGLLVIGQVVAVAGQIERLQKSHVEAAAVERHRGGH
jgi:uroporphyrin-III C-methyltransferase/precorrin-2 dehydrogenase/sirohydrochlorin ferrochelatase